MEPTLLGRRAFLSFLGCAVLSRPNPAIAQQWIRPRTVGVLMGFARDADTQARAKAFEKGLEKEGWTIGKDLRIEYRFSGGDVKRMEAIAQEFVKPIFYSSRRSMWCKSLILLGARQRVCRCVVPRFRSI